METSGRKLRSGGVVPALKSPTKPPKQSSKGNLAPKTGREKAKEAKAAKSANLARAIDQAEAYLEESGEEDMRKLKRGKRTREEDEDQEITEEGIVAEAEALSKKLFVDDKYLKELDSRRSKALDDTERYKKKATLAKTILKGAAATKKSKEIKNKLSQLSQLLVVIRNLTVKRQDEIYAAALQEITEANRSKKKRRTAASTVSEDSVGDGLDVSDGKSHFPIFQSISMPRPSSDDQPTEGDRPMLSDTIISM
jgi:hypothetical protein